mgnify:CR=1 FL=1
MKRNNLINKYYNWIGIEHESMIKKLFYIFRLLLVILYLLFSVYIFPFWLTIFLVVGPILSYGFLKYFRIFPIFSKKSFSPFSDEHGPLTEKESIEKISGLIDIMSEGLPNYKSEKIDNEDGSYTLNQYYDNGKESSVSI